MAADIKGLLKKLGEKDRAKLLDAVNGLGDAAQEGEDIGPAVKALEGFLSGEDQVLRVRGAWALAIHHLQRKDLAGVERLIGMDDESIIYGAIQALPYAIRKGQSIGALVPALEKLLERTEEGMLKGSLVDSLVDHYIMVGAHDSAERLLRHRYTRVRHGAAAAYRNATLGNIDISPALPALRRAMGDTDNDVRRIASEALGRFHANRGEWKEIDGLLGHNESAVRGAIVSLLYSHATKFDIQSDTPNLMKILKNDGPYVRKGVMAILRVAAEKGQDISFAVPVLEGLRTNPMLKEEANLILKTLELREDKGGRCQSCLDCELGVGPGRESGDLEDLGRIEKEIPCCGGVVTHIIRRCKRCKKHYLTSYWDHTGFHAEQFEVYLISDRDAKGALKEIKKCKDPENAKCGCRIHKEYLKNEMLPIKGERKFHETID